MINMKSTIAAGVALCCAMSASAFETEFSYNKNGEDYKVYGYEKKEVYDIAIKINDPTLVGAKITGLYVPIPAENAWITDCSGWVSTELKLENKVNAPNVGSKAAKFDNELLTVDFDEPYTIPAEGIYVGYSFKVVELGEYSSMPIACIEGDAPDALWVHTSRSRLKWTDVGTTEVGGAVSVLVVKLDVNLEGNNTSITLPAESFAKRGDEFSIPTRLVNIGVEAINEIEYSWTAGDYKGSRKYTLPTPVPTGAQNVGTVDVPFNAIDALGEYDMTVTIDKVNGNAISNPERVSSTKLTVIPIVPVKRPLVEEFTGLLCGFCPRGYVAMEQMGDTYGDRFIGMAYHSTTYESAAHMPVIKNAEFPIYVGGFPSGTIDRVEEMDPGYFQREWGSYASEMPVAEIEVSVTDPNAAHEITATSTLTFIKDFTDADYKLSSTVVGDGLKNDAWKQSNYYNDEYMEGDYWNLFIGTGSKVSSLTFNDVVVYAKDVKGIEGSVPARIKAGEPVTYNWTMNVDDIVNLAGKKFLNPEAKLRVVAVLLDGKTGHAINANTTRHLDTSGVETVGIEAAEVVSAEYFDLLGNRVDAGYRGVRIERLTLSDGTVRTVKTIRK